MRIIGGKARGTKLYTLEGENTRPTLDRVKESLFNIIQTEIPNSIFLDLFSGSGDLIDIVYIDPPYKTDYAYESLKILIDNKMLKKDSYIIIETDDEKRIIEQIKSLKVNIVDQRKYGRAYLIFLREQ